MLKKNQVGGVPRQKQMVICSFQPPCYLGCIDPHAELKVQSKSSSASLLSDGFPSSSQPIMA
jgi:hypothetical protein